ncbi:DNA polymerase III subunit psi [Candidatus Pantoea edessiphila]|uniref:DNA polymerase III subunit psi n=1 Tax=Candidatus Pantoea edessiphila TaxID=2044610 RepID=A0A2P5T040_9GAMM|nr:DNA polymerase III subunit psi [Candidatus Pantoea edessiphila]PPI87945.1 DNA polymerase III subunit psi [Candidatus Pantoea edessiphila]
MIKIINYITNHKIDWFLYKLGVNQYKLYRPHLLKGVFNLDILSYIKLIIVTKEIPNLCTSFIKDVLYALNIQSSQVMIIQPEQLKMFLGRLHCIFWLIGIENNPVFKGKFLYTCSLLYLINNSDEKRSLWKQIYNLNNF